jgi:NADPH:quinone reductase-like Zn-dependent oxidoreductase
MKAIVLTQYGPPVVLQLKDVEKPTPKDHQVLVKVHAASINALDWRRFEKQSLLGRFMDEVVIKAGNNVLGTDVAGRVEAVGSSVTELRCSESARGVLLSMHVMAKANSL